MVEHATTNQEDGKERKQGTADSGHLRRSAGVEQDSGVLLNSSPGWLNWAAVILAVLIVAGVFLLSAHQLNAPQLGLGANAIGPGQATVGGMALDGETETAAGGPNNAATAVGMAWEVTPGLTLMNRTERVQLFADAGAHAPFLDSYARGGTFLVIEPTGDYDGYPVIEGETHWVRVRAPDGLVGWTPVSSLERVP